MAEIGIEKKKPVWPWIILVLVILAILYFLFFADDDNVDNNINTTTTEEVEDTTVWETESDTADWDMVPVDDTINNTMDNTGFE